jgi:Flp pilus assembly protein CpaB
MMNKDIKISKLRVEAVSDNERDIARKNAKDKEESLHQTIVKLAVIMVTIATLIVFAAMIARTTSDAIKEANSIADQEFNRAVQGMMNDKKVAVTVPVTSVSGATKDLKEGSRVNIYASGYSSVGTSGTTLIFTNMRVLSVEKDNDGDLRAATIEVSTEESLKLVEAATYSELYFGLVNGSSYQAPTEDNMTYTNRPETQQEQVQIPESGDESSDNSIEGKGGGD